jgi:hypothetical protein
MPQISPLQKKFRALTNQENFRILIIFNLVSDRCYVRIKVFIGSRMFYNIIPRDTRSGNKTMTFQICDFYIIQHGIDKLNKNLTKINILDNKI